MVMIAQVQLTESMACRRFALIVFFYLLLLFYFFNTAILKNKIKEILKYNKIILALTILAGKD